MPTINPTRSEVSPLRHVRDITRRRKDKDSTAYETYCALPSPPKPYSTYDYSIVAEIIKNADAAVAKAYKKGAGSGIVTLQSILQAYEQVLPRHGVKPDEDTYYYRLLLKLSLDSEPDWWAKLNRETGTKGGRIAFFPISASGTSSTRSTPQATDSRPSSVYRNSPSRVLRSVSGAAASNRATGSNISTTPTVRSSIPTITRGRISGRASSYRSSTSLARSSDLDLQDAIREAAAQAARLGGSSSWETPASQDTGAPTGARSVSCGASPSRSSAAYQVTAQETPAGEAVAAWAAREAAARAAAAQDAAVAARVSAQQAAWEAANREEMAAFVTAQVRAAGSERDSGEDPARVAQAAALQAAARQAAARLEGMVGQGGGERSSSAALAAQEAAREAAQQATAAARAAEAAVDAARDAARGRFSLSSGRLEFGTPSATLTEGSLRSLAGVQRTGSASAASLDGRSLVPPSIISDGDAPSGIFYGGEGGYASDYGVPSSRYRSGPTSLGSRVPSGISDYDSSYRGDGCSSSPQRRSESRPTSQSQRLTASSQRTSLVSSHAASQRGGSGSLHSAAHGGGGSVAGISYAGTDFYMSEPSTGGAGGLDGSGGGASGIGDSVSMVSARTGRTGMSGSSIPTAISSAVRTGASVRSESGLSTGFNPSSGRASSFELPRGSGAHSLRETGLSAGTRASSIVISSMQSDGGGTSASALTRTSSGRISPAHPHPSDGAMSESGLSMSTHATGRYSSGIPDAGVHSDSGVSLGMRTSGRISAVTPATSNARSESGVSLSTRATGRLSAHESAFPGARSESGLSRSTHATGHVSNVDPSLGARRSGDTSPNGRASDRPSTLNHSTATGSGRSSGYDASTRVSGSMRSDGGVSAGTGAESGRVTSVVDQTDGRRSDSVYMGSVTEYGGGSVSQRPRVDSSISSGIPLSGLVRPGSFTPSAGTSGAGSRHSSERSAGTRWAGGPAASARTSSSTHTGSGGAAVRGSAGGSSSFYGSGVPGDSDCISGPGRESNVSMGTRNLGSMLSSSRSVGGYSSRGAASSSFGGFKSDGSDSDGPQHEVARDMDIVGGGISGGPGAIHVNGSEASFRAAASNGSSIGGPGAAAVRSPAASLRASSRSSVPVPRGSGGSVSSGAGPRPGLSYSAWSEGAGSGAAGGSRAESGSGAGSAGGGALQSAPSVAGSHRSSEHLAVGRSSAGSAGALQGPGADDGFSFHSATAPGSLHSVASGRSIPSIRSNSSADDRPASANTALLANHAGAGPGTPAAGPMRAGVASAGGFGHVSNGGAESFVPGPSPDPGLLAQGSVHSAGGIGGGSREITLGLPGLIGGPVVRMENDDGSYSPFAAAAGASYAATAVLDGPYAGSVRAGQGQGRAGAGYEAPYGAGSFGAAPSFAWGPPDAAAATASPRYGVSDGVPGGFAWIAARSGGDVSGDSSGGGSGGAGGGFLDDPRPLASGAWGEAAGSGGGGGPPSPPESDLPEEAEAYMDFSRMARAFRTWRRNTSTSRMSRSERDQALHNWAVATSFWAVQLLRRCFNRWRSLAPRKALIAMSIWGDSSRAGCFRRWLVFMRFMRSKAAQGDRLWRGRMLQRCWRQWRQYTRSRQWKAMAVKKARDFRTDWILRGCWRLWQAFMAYNRKKALAARKALGFWSGRSLRTCWLDWRQFTAEKRRKTLAARRALLFWSQRWELTCWLEWRKFTLARRRKTLANKRAGELWASRRLRGCWLTWRFFTAARRRKMLLVALAVKFWMGSSLRGCWKQWRDFTARRQYKALTSQRAVEFWAARTRLCCLRWWQQYTVARQHKTEATDKALGLWMGRTLSICWSTWTAFTANQQRKALGVAKAEGFWKDRTYRSCFYEWMAQVEDARRNWQLSGHVRMRRILQKWHLEASALAKLSAAFNAIQQVDQRRLLLASMQTLMEAHSARNEASQRLRAALMRLQNRRLLRSFNKLRAARVRGQWKRGREAMAEEWWCDRCLRRTWSAWREAMDNSAVELEAARDHALKVLRPLLRDVFYGWLDWHEDKMLRRSRDAEARRIMDCRRQRLVLRVWRSGVVENRHLAAASQLIMRNEVQRLMVSAMRQLRREHDNARRAADARRVVQRAAARRCLQHWKALGRARQAHEDWRAQRLRLAAVQRARRVLVAWQLVACLHAEHERLVQSCVIRSHRRQAAAVIQAWRGRVLKSVTKRMKMLAALLAWERGLKARAWKAWRAQWESARASASRFALAARHHRTRRLGLCFGVLLALWRAHRELLERAKRFRAGHAAGIQAEVLVAWRQLVGALRWKNMRRRRAVTHAHHRLLAGALYGWYYVARDRVTNKQAVAVAVLHWVRRRRAAAFAWWRVWATSERALRLRCEGYALVRAARTKAWVLLMLRANVVRNARIAGAVAHRQRYMARLALSGWLLRTLLAGEWVSRLRVVAEQLSVQLLARSLAAWLEFVEYRRRKHGMVRTALHYWRLGRQRSALDSLRWHATRRQIMRAAVMRGRQGAACRVLRAWREEATHRRGLRDRYAMMLARHRRTALRSGLDRWRAFLALRAFRRDQQYLAEQHNLRGIAARAFRSWHSYHMQLHCAKERAQAIMRRWRRRDAAEALAAFAENVVFQRKMRDAAAVFVSTCTRRAFAAWREFLVLKRATDFWSHNRLNEVVAAWHQFAVSRRLLRAVGEQIALRWRSLTAALVLAAWRDRTMECRRLMQLGFILASKTTRSAMAALLTAWMLFAARSAHLKRTGAELAARVRASTLSACLAGWRATAARRAGLKRTAATITSRAQRSMLAAAFGFWCGHAANVARLRLISEQVAARQRRGLMAALLAAWTAHVAREAQLRASLAAVSERVRRGVLAAAFASWRGRAAYKAHLRSSEGMLSTRLRTGTAGRLLSMWHAYAAYKVHLRIAERHVSNRLQLSAMAAVLEEWHDRAAYKAQLRRAELAVSGRAQLSSLAGAFAGWLERAKFKARCKSACELMHSSRERRLLAAALDGWRGRTAYKAHLTQAEVALARRQREVLLAELCAAWHAHAAYRARLRRGEVQVRARLRRRTLAEACAEWHQYARRMAALKALLERVLLRETALAFLGWREEVAEAKRWRAVQEGIRTRMEARAGLGETACYAVARLRMWPLSVAFYTWYDNARETCYLRDRTTDAVFMYAASLMRKAWSTWLGYTLRRRHMRKKLTRCRAAARTKTLVAVLREWRQVVLYHARLRLAAAVLRDKVDYQALRFMLRSWRDTAARWVRLKGILAHTMARLLSLAWEAWVDAVLDSREKAQAVSVIASRWARRDLVDMLRAWRRLVTCIRAARRLLAQARRRRVEWAWSVWQEVVFQEGVARGGELHGRQVARRVIRGWHAVAADSRRGAQLKAQLQQRLALKALMEWRKQWLARTSCRRLYSRRALLGWHERTQELRQTRARLWHATRVILFGSLARSFNAWLQHTQAMVIKRAVFVRKQRALAEALRRGDELAARRNAELSELAFRAWRLRASIQKEVRRRQSALRARLAAAICAEWREYARGRRSRAAKLNALVRRRLLARPLSAWRQVATAAAAKLDVALCHRRAVLLDAAMAAWQLHHGAVEARRNALRRALAAGAAAGTSALRSRAWEAWCEFMVRRMALREAVEQAYQRRRRSMLGEAFDVWLKYTQAMRSGGIDPGSPFMTPRERGADRWLVTRMAALAGNEQALGASEESLPVGLLEGLYPSSALKHAMERRHEVAAFLSAARHTASAGGARGGGRSGPAAAAFASAMLVERQRQRERRDSQGSATAGVSASASIAGSSHSSALTSTLSSGAGGVDLSELALHVVRAAPALSPPGKTRAPATSRHPGHYTAATPRTSKPFSPELGGAYDDRLDLRALYDVSGPRAGTVQPPAPPAPPAVAFGGFTPSRQLAGSPMPLPRTAATPANPAHIAPRRIDFTVGRGAAAGASVPPAAFDNSQHYYVYSTPSRAQQPHTQPGQQQQYGQAALPFSGRADADSDVSSTTSSDLLAPEEARARAAAAAAATAEEAAAAAAAAAASAAPGSSWRGGATPGGRGSAVKGSSWGSAQLAAGNGRGGAPQPSSSGVDGSFRSRTPAAAGDHQAVASGRAGSAGSGGFLRGDGGGGGGSHTLVRNTPGGRAAGAGSGGMGGGGGGTSSAAAAAGGFHSSILDSSRRAVLGR